MYSRKLLRTLILPAAVAVVEKEKNKNNVCRPSELPIYVPDPPPSKIEEKPEKFSTPTVLEDGFGQVRRQVTKFWSELEAYQRVGLDYLEQSKDNADWILKYLREEDNTTPKAGAIAIGALTGFIFGLRGRFFKRTLYTATGALGMAAICYPKEASEYSQVAITEAKKYATIAYNFAYGVKKGDPPLELPTMPKIPSSFSEAWDSVSKSASSLVSGSATSTEQKNVTAEKH